jgi:MFS family permease
MRALLAYTRLYKESLLAALAGTFKNPWTFLLPMVLAAAAVFLGTLLGPMGLVGGILFMLAMDALLSAYLYFMGQIVEGGKTSPKEWKASLGRYFWAIINYFFILWLGFLLLGLLFGKLPQWPAIQLGAQILCLVAFNAVPETLYIRGTHGSLETVRQSFQFMQDNWVVWLLPNVLFGLLAWGFVKWHPFPFYGVAIVLGVFLHLFMAFRGFLFVQLDKSTHRQRMHHLGR